MKNNIPIKLKAAFLLMVFALNTVVGFACAAGLNMGFNSNHHHEAEEQQEAAVPPAHHHHDEASTIHHHDEDNGAEKGGCCNDSVIKLQQIDKNTSQNPNITIPPSFVVIISSFFRIKTLLLEHIVQQQFAANDFHPPPDIRIAIQSFQI